MTYTLTFSRTRGTWQAIDTITDGKLVAEADTKESLVAFMHSHGWLEQTEEI